ncbi:unnamed protein product [Paramecium primaurelia]|uniref:Uncharacterized protein n=2 Tax=Paramecium TaxID=5884 RepID=A0A8S1T6R2_9CILI|nr:unnamed protein product [Paramecium primaurelia]CAD8147448.1 unnamed protein product [Paramecium pentaurelia]
MSNKIQEGCVSARQKLYNDQEFRDVVKTFHEIVIQINKSVKKQKKKKQNQQPSQQIQTKKKEEFKLFRRNSYHIQIAYKLYNKNKQQNQIDECDPTYHSKKLRNSNLMELENQLNNHNNNHIPLNETSLQK